MEITHEAGDRFIHQNWKAVQSASLERIELYNLVKQETVDLIVKTIEGKSQSVSRSLESQSAIPRGMSLTDWRSAKACYGDLVNPRSDAELARTVYNTVFRAVAGREALSESTAFTGHESLHQEIDEPLTRKYRGQDLSRVLRSALEETSLPLAGIEADVQQIAKTLSSRIPILRAGPNIILEMARPVFYRNKGAYLIGRLIVEQHIFPLAIPLCHKPDGIRVDGILWGENRLSVIFSFTRSYFMVDIPRPAPLVNYLQTLLPVKKRWELYTSIGYYKQGKTEFVRDFREHLVRSADNFEVAAGIKGQVMMVFSLPSYQTVFKIIKDKFPATKSVSREDVRAAYYLVKTHDRVGRMADTQEFHHFSLPRTRFPEVLMQELLKVASGSVTLTEDEVIVSHLYTERLMTPLNIYVFECNEFQLRQVLDDYGLAIKQLAAANIFPGDMLLKNFGVTRHGRVVFYDYDEICYLTAVNFRELPQAQNTDESISAEPWFEVGAYDVFPQEFARFLFPDDHMFGIFSELHGDLFTVAGWQRMQSLVKQDELTDVYPYPSRERFGFEG